MRHLPLLLRFNNHVQEAKQPGGVEDGADEARLSGRVAGYGYRHTYGTNTLAKGVPDATVAALLGHSSTSMLHKHYSHLTSQAGVLRNASALVRPGAAPEPIAV